MLLAAIAIIGVIASPNAVQQKIDNLIWLPINLYVNGDIFYYVLYVLLGRATGIMETKKKRLTLFSSLLFFIAAFAISRGTAHELMARSGFYDTYYRYCGPLVLICAVSLFVLAKNRLNRQ